MTFVEFLRVRHALVVYAIIVGAIALLTLIGTLFAGSHVEVETVGRGAAATHIITHTSVRAAVSADFRRHGHTVPISALLVLAGYGATVMASIFAIFLSRERLHVPMAWTKPVSRERFALAYLGIDVAGIAVAFAVCLAGEFVVLWAVGLDGFVAPDRYVTSAALLTGGMALAYYGIVRACAAAFPAQAGGIAGGSWGVFIVLIILAAAPFPTVVHDILMAVNFLNPLAYLTNFDQKHGSSVLPVSADAGLALVWLLAIVSGALAVLIYRRPEA